MYTKVGNENPDKKIESVYSARIRAGKRRTYFFDVRETRGNDYYLTITESRKKFNDDGYDRHKIFIYKEDFNKFIKGLTEAVEYVKTELMPDFDFDAFNHDNIPADGNAERTSQVAEVDGSEITQSTVPETSTGIAEAATPEIDSKMDDEEVDKW